MAVAKDLQFSSRQDDAILMYVMHAKGSCDDIRNHRHRSLACHGQSHIRASWCWQYRTVAMDMFIQTGLSDVCVCERERERFLRFY